MMALLLWIILAVMTAGVLIAILRPLALGARESAGAPAHDAVVYREQLRELEQEVARGQINLSEAASARAEIARRLLAAGAMAEPASSAPPRAAQPRARNATALAVMTVLPLLSLGLYVTHGQPGLSDAPQPAMQTANGTSEIAALISKVEERLKASPNDGRGWDVIAPVYLRQGRFADAAHAFERATALLGESAARLEGLGEARVLAADGQVTPAARVALARARVLEPARIKPQFFLAMAAEQSGQTAEAVAAYRSLLADDSADESWRSLLTARLSRLSDPAVPAGVGPGPSADDMAAAAGMSEADRTTMIEGMISRLAERLQANGQDREGWLRLIRALSVLGRKDDAQKALGDARRAFGEDADARAALTTLARELGLDS